MSTPTWVTCSPNWASHATTIGHYLLDSKKIARDAIVDIARHRHCVHTVPSSVASRKLEAVSGTANVYLCGSYLGMAPVHEAAITSGIKAAQAVLENWA